VGRLPTSARRHLTADYARSSCGRSILGPGFNSRRLHENEVQHDSAASRNGRRCSFPSRVCVQTSRPPVGNALTVSFAARADPAELGLSKPSTALLSWKARREFMSFGAASVGKPRPEIPIGPSADERRGRGDNEHGHSAPNQGEQRSGARSRQRPSAAEDHATNPVPMASTEYLRWNRDRFTRERPSS
jgi:hypothetical protein